MPVANMVEMAGQKFVMLTVLSRVANNKHGVAVWACVCDCGEYREVPGYCLRNGNTKSCGCLQKETAKRVMKTCFLKHGLTDSSENKAWQTMRSRCYNPKNKAFKHYGGRGIKVCDRWQSFENFYADMGLKPSRNHSIDRRNNNGNYEPGNCRWATRKEQARNKSNNLILSMDGKSQPLSAWVEEYGVSYSMIQTRLAKGATLQQALLQPSRYAKSNEVMNANY